MDDDDYIHVVLDKTRYLLEEGLDAEEALERAAADNNTTVEAVRRFEDELARQPDRLADIAERIMNESAPLREQYVETYRRNFEDASAEPAAPAPPAGGAPGVADGDDDDEPDTTIAPEPAETEDDGAIEDETEPFETAVDQQP